MNFENLCSIEEYEKILSENMDKFNELDEICKRSMEKVEGNCFSEHLNINKRIPELIFKQCNLFSLGRVSNTVMEIGFNAGHSCLLYLLANDHSKIVIFDICDHKYTMPCFEYLQYIFPNRLEMYPGDSTVTVPLYTVENPTKKFDLIHIDGCHITSIANSDFYNSLKMANNMIIWDDTQISPLNELFNDYLAKGILREVLLHKTYVYQHRIGKVL